MVFVFVDEQGPSHASDFFMVGWQDFDVCEVVSVFGDVFRWAVSVPQEMESQFRRHAQDHHSVVQVV